MTLEVLFAQQGQAETFLRMVLLGAAFALALNLGGAWRHRHGLSDAAYVLCALMLTLAALLVLIHSVEGLRLYALRGLLLGAGLWETGIRRILRWIGKRLKKRFPSGRNMQNHSE